MTEIQDCDTDLEKMKAEYLNFWMYKRLQKKTAKQENKVIKNKNTCFLCCLEFDLDKVLMNKTLVLYRKLIKD